MKRLVTILLLIGATFALVAALTIRPRIGHPVTPWMSTAAAEATGRPILPLPQMTRNQPLVVVFIMPGCPCSEEYEKYTHQLFHAYSGHARFVGIVAGDSAAAEEWQRGHQTPFPVIADTDRSFAQSYGADRSAYTALVTDGRTISRLWPGYSNAMLQELGGLLAVAAGIDERPFNTAGAPKTLTSGCPIEIEITLREAGTLSSSCHCFAMVLPRQTVLSLSYDS